MEKEEMMDLLTKLLSFPTFPCFEPLDQLIGERKCFFHMCILELQYKGWTFFLDDLVVENISPFYVLVSHSTTSIASKGSQENLSLSFHYGATNFLGNLWFHSIMFNSNSLNVLEAIEWFFLQCDGILKWNCF